MAFGVFGSKKKQKTTGSKTGTDRTDVQTEDARFYDEDIATLRNVLGMARLGGGRMNNNRARLQKASFVENIDAPTTEPAPANGGSFLDDLFGVENPFAVKLMNEMSGNRLNPATNSYVTTPFDMRGASDIIGQDLDPMGRVTEEEMSNVGLSPESPVNLDGISESQAENFVDQLPEGAFFMRDGKIRRKTNDINRQNNMTMT